MLPLQIDGISKSFKKKKVLDNVSFSLNSQEIFGLVGLNGVGKTTLIKIILDLLKADAGKVSFFSQPSTDRNSRKSIAYLPEKFQPSAFLTGHEFLSLSVSFYKKNYDPQKAELFAEQLALDPKALKLSVQKYSKGMGQKLGLLSMFLVENPLLILDEPMSGLDPRARIRLKGLLQSYQEQGNTIFFSSHILADIEEICDKIGIIHDGRLLFTGTPHAFLDQYKEANLERAFLKAIEEPVSLDAA